MRKVHIYNVGGKTYASAAEAVPAVLSGEIYHIVAHSTVGFTCAVAEAIERTVHSLRYSLVKNIHASLLSAAVLILMAWPLVYNAIPMPEIVVAARVASGTCALVGLVASLVAGLRIHRLNKVTDFKLATIVYKHDGLLPPTIAWGKDRRRIAFPWLGLGLILLSIALNCVVVADYAHPAILNDGTVRYSVGFVAPWATWKNGARYAEGEFVVPFGRMWGDPQHVLRVKYRIRNMDIDTLIPGPEKWEAETFFVARYLVGQVSDGVRTAAPANTSPGEVAELVGAELDLPSAAEAFAKWFNGQVLEKYPNLQLEQMALSIEVMSKSEFGKAYQAQAKRWELQ